MSTSASGKQGLQLCIFVTDIHWIRLAVMQALLSVSSSCFVSIWSTATSVLGALTLHDADTIGAQEIIQ